MGTPDELESLRGESRRSARLPDASSPTCATTRRSRPAWPTAIERFGRIDVLFNNAGICAYGLAHELTEAEWDAMIDINLKGAWIVARHVIPHMIAARARRDRQQLARSPACAAWAASRTTRPASGA